MTSSELMADTPLRQLTLTLNPSFFWTNNALFAAENTWWAKTVGHSLMSNNFVKS